MAEIKLDGVTKEYPGGVRAVDDVTLTIASGEFMVLVGPSGCGKSTLLRMIAGLEVITAGDISIGERVVTNLSPRDRDVAMVFQNYALYPHLSVRKNLGYGLRMRKTPKNEIDRRVDEVAAMLGLKELLDRRPGALSGGQRQRVAMGRAIVREPQAFLMDEPLSNLDAKLRVDMRGELARLHERLGVTTVYVTHDQIEAMTLGQRVAVMSDGRLQQVDTPQTLYRRPANLFVAAFIGSPSMNLVEATIDDGHVEFAGFRIPLPPASAPDLGSAGTVILGVRPQDFEDAAFADPSHPTIDVEVAVVEELGAATHLLFPVDAAPVDAAAVLAATDENERAVLLAGDQRTLFTAEVSESSAARAGAAVTLAVNPSRFHFFEPESGAALSRGPVPAGASNPLG
jgi:multiple sugar transport system ATP-binding protein